MYKLFNDLGISPSDLSGTNTAVFMSSCISESELFGVVDDQEKGFSLLGNNRAMQANRLSYTLNLNGKNLQVPITFSTIHTNINNNYCDFCVDFTQGPVIR